jgi:striatin 1/3/4
MNPLPNRPLLNNTSLPLTLPNVPSFDQIAYNGRPRKVMPEAGKDYSILNSINMVSGPSSAPAGPGVPLERSSPMGSVMLQQNPVAGAGQSQQQQQHNLGHMPNPQQSERDKEPEPERLQLTAIFRPDDAGEWREKLRLLHDAQDRAERLDAQTRMDRLGSSLLNVAGASSWERRREDDEEVKEEEPEVEEEESSAVGDADTSKVWKPKRTLRKFVFGDLRFRT